MVQDRAGCALLPKPLQDLILEFEYTDRNYSNHGKDDKEDDSNFKSNNYTSTQVGPGLFESRLPVITLLRHVVRGEYKQVDSMLTKNPLLLFEADDVLDYSCGHVFHRKHHKRTAYQLALGAVDRNVTSIDGNHVVLDGMIELIEKHFHSPQLLEILRRKSPDQIKKIKNKFFDENDEVNTKDLATFIEKIRQKQHEGQYPKGHEEKEQARIENDSKALNIVVNVVKQASQEQCELTSILEDGLHKMRCHGKSEWADTLRRITEAIMIANSDAAFDTAFTDLTQYSIKQGYQSDTFDFGLLKAIYRFRHYLEPKGALTSGKHFNLNLLEEAMILHDQEFSTKDDSKNKICWQKIVGYVHRFVPTCDAQIIIQGLYRLVSGLPLKRTLFFYDGSDYYSHYGESQLGHNHANRMRADRYIRDNTPLGYGILKTFCASKSRVPLYQEKISVPLAAPTLHNSFLHRLRQLIYP